MRVLPFFPMQRAILPFLAQFLHAVLQFRDLLVVRGAALVLLDIRNGQELRKPFVQPKIRP